METKPTLTFAMLGLALATAACTGNNGQPAQNEEASAPLVSVVKMSDARAGRQLRTGFYTIENGTWRWTAGKFSVQLATPVGASQNGGTLTFSMAIPDGVARQLGTMTLTASINGKTLGSTSYNTAGPQVFTADVPKELLTGESVTVEFAFDKRIAPGTAGGDRRELAVQANSVGLASK